jgi:subtilisin family serine protease
MLKISAPAAWDVTKGSTENVVGVVDTGINYNHPDLADNVWTAPQGFSVTVAGVTCGAGTHGFNAIRKTCDPMDDNGHGSHVSGTIGAKGNNGIGVVGVNWTASIMGLKFLNSRGSGSTSDAIDAIEYAIQARLRAGVNVRVLSTSWGGGGFSQLLLDEIKKANDQANMLFVASAGNSPRNIDDSESYPASYALPEYGAPNVLAVAATDQADALASFSSFGVSAVGLAAPGVDIYSTARSGYETMSGTSMAAPHVSGAAALVLSVPACSALTPEQLKSVLVVYTDSVNGLSGKVRTGGRLNVVKAVTQCGIVPTLPDPADFSIAATPPSLSVPRGSTAVYTISVAPVPPYDFTRAVNLSVTQVPTGATATLEPKRVTCPGLATLSVTPGAATKTSGWTYIIKITGESEGLVHSTTVRFSATR